MLFGPCELPRHFGTRNTSIWQQFSFKLLGQSHVKGQSYLFQLGHKRQCKKMMHYMRIIVFRKQALWSVIQSPWDKNEWVSSHFVFFHVCEVQLNCSVLQSSQTFVYNFELINFTRQIHETLCGTTYHS